MDFDKRNFLAASLMSVGGAAVSAGTADAQTPAPPRRPGAMNRSYVFSGKQPSTVDHNYKPRRFNKVIELWEDNQPIYYTDARIVPGVDPYALGIRMCQTWADAINVSMEHDVALDFGAFRAFMRGVADGGPTRSGHRMPCVFTTCPVIGLDEAYMRANSWVLYHLLDSGAMGTHLCHARDARAVQVAAQMACRYPFDYPNTPKVPMEGLRGSSANFAAEIWGMSTAQYAHIADTWPLNPKGELIFGCKVEDKYGVANVDKILDVQGISFTEWGPGDQNYWLNGLAGIPTDGSRRNVEDVPNMMAARAKVLAAAKKRGIRFLNSAGRDVIKQIQDGVMVIAGGEESAIAGREYTKRKMPV
jgi:4-hydroxy-2-oxoheptanedioate aldolase